MLQVNIRKSRTVRDFTTDLHKLIYWFIVFIGSITIAIMIAFIMLCYVVIIITFLSNFPVVRRPQSIHSADVTDCERGNKK